MKLDMKGLKKISTDAKSTTFMHPKGHEVRIAHKALSPKFRKDLEGIPHFAQGGMAEPDLSEYQNPVAPLSTPMEAPAAAPVASVDPYSQKIKDFYNINAVARNPDIGDAVRFNNGKEPEIFDSESWKKAEQEVSQLKEMEAAKASKAAVSGAEDNAVRQRAGLAPLAVPSAPIAPEAAPLPGPAIGPSGPAPAATNPMANYGSNYQTGSMMGDIRQGYNKQLAGIESERQAASDIAKRTADIQSNQVQAQQNLMAKYDEKFNAIQAETNHIVDYMNKNPVDRERYIKGMSMGEKIGVAIGSLIGTNQGGQNGAAEWLNKQIDRDIEVQKENLGTQKSLLSANMQKFGNLKEAMAVTANQMAAIHSSMILEAGAKSGSQMALANAQKAAGDLLGKRAEAIQKIAMTQSARDMLYNDPSTKNLDPSSKATLMMRTGVMPAGDHTKVMEELKDKAELDKVRHEAMTAFNLVAKTKDPAWIASHPREAISGAQEQQLNASFGVLSRKLAGKFSEFENHNMEKQFKPKLTDSAADIMLRRKNLELAINQAANYPYLKAWNLMTEQADSAHGFKPKTFRPAGK